MVGADQSIAVAGSLCSYHHHLVHEGGYRLTRNAGGEIEVRVPAGWLLPAAPPLRQSSADQLAASNAAAGADVSAETLPPDWAGDSLDLNYAVGVLLAG